MRRKACLAAPPPLAGVSRTLHRQLAGSRGPSLTRQSPRAVIDVRLALARAVREERAKAGDSSVSIDLFVRSLLGMGASRRDLTRWLARTARTAA